MMPDLAAGSQRVASKLSGGNRLSDGSPPVPLKNLLTPRSIVLVGVTESSTWSQNLVSNLRTLGFGGRLHFVNPNHKKQFGQPCYPSMAEVQDVIDAAFVMTGTNAALSIVEECAALGIRSVTMLTSGFRESGPQGASLEQELATRCRRAGINLLGPNCLGFINYSEEIVASALTHSAPLIRGSIGVVSQSGAMVLHLYRLAQQRGVGLSYLVSSGNEAILEATDFLEFMLEDEGTRVVGAVLEGIRDPLRFRVLASRALDLKKPLVVLKLGRSEAARRAAIAHTGALAGEDRVLDAVFRQFGVLRVHGVEELIETSAALAADGWPTGRRFGVVTASGGAAGLIADLADGSKVEIPAFATATAERLAGIIPEFGTPLNPLDITGRIVLDMTLISRAVEAVAADPNVDGVFVNTDLPREPGPRPELMEERLSLLSKTLRALPKFSYISSTVSGELTNHSLEIAHRHGLHFANGLHLALRALNSSLEYSEALERSKDKSTMTRRSPAAPPISSGLSGPLSEVDSMRLISHYGIKFAAGQLASSATEAESIAVAIGFPVVLKIQSRDLPHKTDVGGVRLSLHTPGEVATAYAEILAAVRRERPDAHLEGVLVAQQITPIAELLVGVLIDPQFGPVVMAGSGGVFADVMGDVALRLAPINEREARSMLSELGVARLLAGVRGRGPGDANAVIDVLIRLGEIAIDLQGRISEIDVNPLFVMSEGHGATAGDALVVLK